MKSPKQAEYTVIDWLFPLLDQYIARLPESERTGLALAPIGGTSGFSSPCWVPQDMWDGTPDDNAIVHWKPVRAVHNPQLPFFIPYEQLLSPVLRQYLRDYRCVRLPLSDSQWSLQFPATPTHAPTFDFDRIAGNYGTLLLSTYFSPFATTDDGSAVICSDRRGASQTEDSPVVWFSADAIYRLSPQLFELERGHQPVDHLAQPFFPSITTMLEHFCGANSTKWWAVQPSVRPTPQVEHHAPFDWEPLLPPEVSPNEVVAKLPEPSEASLLPHLERIADKVRLSQALDPHFIAVGSEFHRHRMNPTLHESERAEFEKSQGCSLPSVYAAFLSVVGNGGSGPDEGLWRLEYSGDLWASVRDGGQDGYEERLRKPFPHREPWKPDVSNYTTRQSQSYFHPKRIHGTIKLAEAPDEYGRIVTWLLVVNGPERGHIWADHRLRGLGVTPVYRRGPLSFLVWYEEGLDGTIEQLPEAYARHRANFTL